MAQPYLLFSRATDKGVVFGFDLLCECVSESGEKYPWTKHSTMRLKCVEGMRRGEKEFKKVKQKNVCGPVQSTLYSRSRESKKESDE